MNNRPAQTDTDRIILAHGGGGELTRRLLAEHVLGRLSNPLLDPLTDGAFVPVGGAPVCFTTDAYVVTPVEFPGGTIGDLAVCGTVNDLAVMGAVPQALSLALIIEEGLPIATLERIVDAIAASAERAGVVIATGDTKVIERRSGDGLMITTAGVGAPRPVLALGTGGIVPGDVVLVSGRIAEHGLAVMSAREGLAFTTSLLSDVAPLNGLIAAILDVAAGEVRFLRDPTRGGLAGVLCDLAEATGLSIDLDEAAVPISPVAAHTADMLGLDPLTVANEGKCVIVAAADAARRVLDACRTHPLGGHAAIVGTFTEASPPLVELITRAGGRRIVQRPYGEDLPRIC
ncbi:MAG: hydrogenase expression/formation protein HypE [Planctomycetes bacterium]|nr:hydrogenase expression/formation protein HypE [Planctomycetota bacterium]